MQPAPKKIQFLLAEEVNGCAFIPEYQRRYSWGQDIAHYLIRDVVRAIEERSPHWIGVSISRKSPNGLCRSGIELDQFPNHHCREIIDGQQRLATLFLWMLAIRDHSQDLGEQVARDLPCIRFQFPDDEMIAGINSDPRNAVRNSSKISEVYLYFRFLLWLGAPAFKQIEPVETPIFKFQLDEEGEEVTESLLDLFQRSVNDGSKKLIGPQLEDLNSHISEAGRFLTVLNIEIGPDEDAIDVFAALNGNRVPLSQFDLLRNFLYEKVCVQHGQAGSDIWRERWRPIEEVFAEMPIGSGNTTASNQEQFLYDFLISMGRGASASFNRSTSFFAFRRYYEEDSEAFSSIESWLKGFLDDLIIWTIQRSNFSHSGVLPSGKKIALQAGARRSLARIRYGSQGPPAPLVMFVLRRGALPSSSQDRFDGPSVARVLKALETFVFKTLLLGDSMTNLRSEIIGKMSEWSTTSGPDDGSEVARRISEDIKALPQPTWADITPKLLKQHEEPVPRGRSVPPGIYGTLGSRGTLAVLDAVSQALGDGKTLLQSSPHTIDPPHWVEHIYPQSADRWAGDRSLTGADRVGLQARTNSLGNLSAIAKQVNMKLSRKRFSEKVADLRAEFSVDTNRVPKLLNKWALDGRSPQTWKPSTVDKRTEAYVEKLASIWPDN